MMRRTNIGFFFGEVYDRVWWLYFSIWFLLVVWNGIGWLATSQKEISLLDTFWEVFFYPSIFLLLVIWGINRFYEVYKIFKSTKG